MSASKASRLALILLIVLSAVASLFFGLRSYGSFLLLRSAYQVGQPQVSSLRAWMTLDYVATTYRVPAAELLPRLSLPADFPRDQSLKAIADVRGVSRFDFVRQVQRAIGESAPLTAAGEQSPDGVKDRVLSAILVYGYPAFALTLLLGAVGLPLPIGLAAVLAGSLAALGKLQWGWAAAVAVIASFGGDMIAYGIGRAVNDDFLARRGRWLGYTPQRRERIQSLLRRWGGITVLISRTLVSSLSSIISLLSGVSRYRFWHFLVFALLGRLVWTTAYLGLGYGIGQNLDAASDFMANLSGLLASLAVLAIAGATQAGLFARARP